MNRIVIFILILCFFNACKQERIRTFNAPKEIIPLISLSSNQDRLDWKIPEHWLSKSLNEFRKASYDIPVQNAQSVDFSIVSFPGDAGGLLQNVNRWRQQLNLSPIDEQSIQSFVKIIEHEQLNIVLFEFDNSDSSMMVAVFSFNQETYFIKALGDTLSVNSIANDFIQVLYELQVG